MAFQDSSNTRSEEQENTGGGWYTVQVRNKGGVNRNKSSIVQDVSSKKHSSWYSTSSDTRKKHNDDKRKVRDERSRRNKSEAKEAPEGTRTAYGEFSSETPSTYDLQYDVPPAKHRHTWLQISTSACAVESDIRIGKTFLHKAKNADMHSTITMLPPEPRAIKSSTATSGSFDEKSQTETACRVSIPFCYVWRETPTEFVPSLSPRSRTVHQPSKRHLECYYIPKGLFADEK
jgi:hypothetical protein